MANSMAGQPALAGYLAYFGHEELSVFSFLLKFSKKIDFLTRTSKIGATLIYVKGCLTSNGIAAKLEDWPDLAV